MKSLGTRLAVVISSIVLVLVVVFATWLNSVQTEAIERQSIEHIEVQAQTLLGTLKTLMMNGDGVLVRQWLTRLQDVSGVENVTIMRRDGSVAFSDLRTVDLVNQYLGRTQFQRAPSVPDKFQSSISPQLLNYALQGRTGYDLTVPGVVTIVQPIQADAQCLSCHGYDDSMLRGVLKLSISSQLTLSRIQEMQSMVWGSGLLLVVLLAVSLWLALRFNVLKPISVLREAIVSAAEGNRSTQVLVAKNDELSELAKEFNQMQKGLAEGEARVRAVTDNVADGIITITEQGLIDSVNPAMEHIFEYQAAELIGQHVNILIPDENRKNRDAFLLEDLDDGGVVVGVAREISGKKKNGEIFPIDLAVSDMRLGERIFYIGIVRDITVRKARVAALHYQAMHDALTDLPNRTLLLDRLQQAIRTAEREEHKLALILLDLDRFKEVNDTLGHHVGDLLLQQVGARLKTVLRESDTVARLGGDEFCLLLPASHINQAMFIARKVINTVEKPIVFDGVSLSVGASLGIATFPEHGSTPSALLQRADTAMYEAKRNNRGFSVYNEGQNKQTLQQYSPGSELRGAIESDQLVLHYQPKIDLRTQTLIGMEALVRWHHPSHGLLAPSKFLPIAEQSGLMGKLTAWVLHRALNECQHYMKKGQCVLISINISAVNLLDPEFFKVITEAVDQYDVSASRIKLEIMETALIDNPKLVIKALNRLNAMGFRISIDDFGKGYYSSLAYLRQLPVSELKIDKLFNRELHTDKANILLVQSTIDMAHRLGLRVVAEGVEDEETLQMLHSLGCDAVQGYYFSQPLPFKDMLAWAEENNYEAMAS